MDGAQALRPELVIFDCDGVLVDSEPASNSVLAEMLTERGCPMTLARTKAVFQGMLMRDLAARAEELLGHSLPPGWITEYERRRTARFDTELQPIPGVAELIHALIGAGLPFCVASQGRLEKTGHSLALTGLDIHFAEFTRFSAYQVPRGKPHPDLFLFAAAAMGFEPSRCVVIEDTPSGVTAACRAGMEVFGYAGETDALELQRAGARPVGAMTELAGLLGARPARKA